MLRPGAVLLHVYNLNEALREANKALTFGSEVVAIGGAFHVGTEVYGGEWSYGVYGVTCIPPRSESGHIHQCTVYMGNTMLDRCHLAAVLQEMAEGWCGDDYDVL